MEKLTDSSPCPQKGKHYGVEMQKIPYYCLNWLEQQKFCRDDVKEYIEENRDVLDLEYERDNFNKYRHE